MLSSCLQAVLASNLELFRAQEKKNKECQQLRQDVELKDAQIAVAPRPDCYTVMLCVTG